MLPLEGRKILSFETWGSGAFHAQLLAMLGAKVINIEDPRKGGNPLRTMGNIFFDKKKQINTGSSSCMHNKLSLGLDIRRKKGQEIFHKLVEQSDAVINNFRGSIANALQITYNDLKRFNKNIVCVHLSGYGRNNERADWPGYDFLMQAELGWMSLTGEPNSLPTKVGVSVIDIMGGVYAALCTVSGILQMEQTGKGCDADTNLFDIALTSLTYQAMWYLNNKIMTGKQPRSAHTTQVPSQIYKTSDGWIYIACVNPGFWELLCKKINRNDLLVDKKFNTNSQRLKNRDILTKKLDNIFSKHPTKIWMKKLAGDIPCAQINDIAEALENNFVKNNEKIINVPYGKSKKIAKFIAPPFRFSSGKHIEYKMPPRFGEHTGIILRKLGYSTSEIGILKKEKIIV